MLARKHRDYIPRSKGKDRATRVVWSRASQRRIVVIRRRVPVRRRGPLRLDLFEPRARGFEFKAVVANKRRMARRGDDLSPLLRDIGEEIVNSTRERFRAQRAPATRCSPRPAT